MCKLPFLSIVGGRVALTVHLGELGADFDGRIARPGPRQAGETTNFKDILLLLVSIRPAKSTRDYSTNGVLLKGLGS
jgi:hypothetical protein